VDYDLIQAAGLPPGNHPGGNLSAFADGSARFLSSGTPAGVLHSLSTRAGGEPVTP
jgi:hypothetical protein